MPPSALTSTFSISPRYNLIFNLDSAVTGDATLIRG